jgi:hypothetical protein
MKQEIALRKKCSFLVNVHKKCTQVNIEHIMALNAEMMSLGYIMSKELFEVLSDSGIR